MGQWSNLENFWVNNNQFSAQLPQSISQWSNLETFFIQVSEAMVTFDSIALPSLTPTPHSGTGKRFDGTSASGELDQLDPIHCNGE